MLRSLGQPDGQRSGAAADVKHPPTGSWQSAEKETVVVGIVVPLEHQPDGTGRISPTSRTRQPKTLVQ